MHGPVPKLRTTFAAELMGLQDRFLLRLPEGEKIPDGGRRMRNCLAFGLVLVSGMVLFYSGMQVYRCFQPRVLNDQLPVRLVRIEGKNCPLYFPEEQ